VPHADHAKQHLELGPIREGYLTELIHARPRTWKGCQTARSFTFP
jgi:hypothetical protein